MDIPDSVHADLEALGFDLSGAMLERLAIYLEFLMEYNRRVNLTAVRSWQEAWHRLIIDSLTLLPALENFAPEATVIDIGSGGGLPGIPIAVTREDLSVTLLEATGKKSQFLDSCIERLGLHRVTTIQGRAEIIGRHPEHRQQYDVAVSRAIGTMSVVLEYSLPLVKVGGAILAMKGPKAEAELAAAADAMAVLGAGELAVFDAYPDSFENQLVVIAIGKDRPTPWKYPRDPGIPKRAPL